jgi:hypothetical protein
MVGRPEYGGCGAFVASGLGPEQGCSEVKYHG